MDERDRTMLARCEANVSEELSQGNFYDAHKEVRSALSRLVTRGHKDAAVEFCRKYAELFMREYKQVTLGADLGSKMVDMFKEQGRNVDDDLVKLILDIYSAAEEPTLELLKFLEKATLWSRDAPKSQLPNGNVISNGSSIEPTGDCRLHLALALSYERLGHYGEVQSHLIFCKGEGWRLGELIRKWRKQGYKSETDLFLLRLILMLLAMKDVATAEQIIQEELNEKGDQNGSIETGANVPAAPLQLAYFLTQSCQSKNFVFYEMVKSRYQLVVRRDSLFDTLLAEIEKVVFSKPRRSSNIIENAGGILSALTSTSAAIST